MKLNNHKYALGIGFALALVACSGSALAQSFPPRSLTVPAIDGPPVLGEPYSIGAKRYEPKDDNAFDQVGYARVFGEDRRGAGTPNGEQVNPDIIEVAHQTLPMPSYVEITHLDTGRTILARVNNRGPMTTGAIVELSPAAARELGIETASTPVRVRRVNPPMPERAALRSGRPAGPRLDTPPALLSALRRKMRDEGIAVDRGSAPATAVAPPSTVAARPAAKPSTGGRGADFAGPVKPRLAPPDVEPELPEPPTTAPPRAQPARPTGRGAWYVQLAAFGKEAAAQEMADEAGAKAFLEAGGIWRVRAGPYPSEAAARGAVQSWQGKGYPNARADFGMAAPNGARPPAPPAAPSVAWHVQLGAFGSRDRATAFARKLGVSNIVEAGGIWRVRAGPYADEDSARDAAADWQEKGHSGARVSR